MTGRGVESREFAPKFPPRNDHGVARQTIPTEPRQQDTNKDRLLGQAQGVDYDYRNLVVIQGLDLTVMVQRLVRERHDQTNDD